MSVKRKAADFAAPFRVAISGIVYTFRTQKHMRFHLYVVFVVLLLAILAKLALRETLVLLFTISLVLVAEMFNSAIEATVDLVSPGYHPMAKFAKDIAAGAVLVTTIIALVVGSLLLLGEQRWEAIKINLTTQGFEPPIYTRLILGVFLVILVVIIGKGLGRSGRVLSGGLVSGHAALGFFFAASTIFMSDTVVVPSIALVLALMIAQSRYEAKIHSLSELSLGAAVGIILAVVMFWFLPR